MTPEERQMLSGLFERIRGANTGPRDQEADAFIADAMRQSPSAAYVMAQTVLVQQQAIEAATKRISDLEQTRSGGDPAQQEGGSFLGNLGRSLFGGAPQAPGAAPRSYDPRAYERDPGNAPQRPAYAPAPQGYAPQQGGPWGAPQQQPAQGGGFLSGALTTATGVAGGMLAANALEGLLGGHRGGGLFGGGGGGSGFGGSTETVNNYYGTDPAGQRAEDTLQDQDQDQDMAQDAADNSSDVADSGGGGDDWT